MRILIADDHAMLRQGLKQILLEGFPGADLIETGTTQETLDSLRQNPCDLIILDIFMPGRTGLEVLDIVRLEFPGLPVLVLSSAPEEQLAIRVLKAGASGFLNKQAAPEFLIQAVRKILEGGKYVSEAVAQNLAKEAGRANQLPHQTLSDREFQVMRLLVAGKTLKEVAAELCLSSKTISTFHTRIWQKLGVKNDVELVHYALHHRLVEGTGLTSNSKG